MAPRRSTLSRVSTLDDALGPGPWAVSALLQQGWSQDQVDRAVRAGALTRVRRGIVAEARDVDPQSSTGLAVLLATLAPSAALSHATAAVPQGLWTPFRSDSRVQVTIAGAAERSDSGLRVHGSRLPRELIHVVDGLPMTRPGRTAMDLGRGRSFPDALVAVDGAARALVLAFGIDRWSIRRREVPDDLLAAVAVELDEAFRSVWGWPGTRVLRQALAVRDVASESPSESWSRGVLLLGGLPAPEVNVPVRGRSGREYWGDLVWRRHRLIGEVDGQGKYGDDAETRRRRMDEERGREDDLIAAGWRFVRWGTGERSRVVLARAGRALGLPFRVTA